MDLTVRSVLWWLSAGALVWAIALQGCREPEPPVPASEKRTCESWCDGNGGMADVRMSMVFTGGCKCTNDLYMSDVKSRAGCEDTCRLNGEVLWYVPPEVTCLCQNGGTFNMELPEPPPTAADDLAPATPTAAAENASEGEIYFEGDDLLYKPPATPLPESPPADMPEAQPGAWQAPPPAVPIALRPGWR